MVGIYVRVSTEEQSLHGFSIRAQIDKLTNYCQIRDWKIYDIYKDEGISGKNVVERNELKRLLNDIENKNVDNVLVYKIDRLTRSTKDLIELIDYFNNNNCSFNSLTENIDTLSPTGRMFIKIIGIFAEFERENIIERVKFGLERKVREGYTIASNNISFGYIKQKGNKIQQVCEYEAYVVKRIFYLFLSNYSYTKIADYLNKYNIKSKTNKRWSYKTVKKVLMNPNYIGKVRFGINKNNYFETEGKHNKIIDNKTYELVRNKINKKNNFINIYCECKNKYTVKINKYYSKKRNKMIKNVELHCKKCKKYISLSKYDVKKCKLC